MIQDKLKNLLEPIERLIQFTKDIHLLGENQDKLLSSVSSDPYIADVQLATIQAINGLARTIKSLSDEILTELKL